MCLTRLANSKNANTDTVAINSVNAIPPLYAKRRKIGMQNTATAIRLRNIATILSVMFPKPPLSILII